MLDQKCAVEQKQVQTRSGWTGLIAAILAEVEKLQCQRYRYRQGKGNQLVGSVRLYWNWCSHGHRWPGFAVAAIVLRIVGSLSLDDRINLRGSRNAGRRRRLGGEKVEVMMVVVVVARADANGNDPEQRQHCH
jgi:hypothetical protein